MYLEKLELQGFKSFANKTMLEFRPSSKDGSFKYGITAIVGPNGSGKSNIADAVRWVMGTQSMKQIRGKKSEDVIFSGSDKKTRLGLAEVSLYINNEDGSAPIDYRELIITRKLYRNGESEYLINKNKVRLGDIHLLLAKANMGQRTYSVIGQGMIDSVLIATPQERKEFFDEAAGVKQFQIKRNQAINKLEASEENLAQAEALLAEIEPRMRSLTRQVRRLEKRGEVEQELRKKQLIYYGSQWQEIQHRYQNQNSQFSELDKKRLAKEKEARAVQEKLNSLEEEESPSNAFNSLQTKYEKIINERNKLREQEMFLRSKIEVQKRLGSKAPSSMPLEDIIGYLENIDKLQDNLLSKIKSAKSLNELEAIKYNALEINDKYKELLEKIKNPVKNKIKIDPKLLQEIKNIAQKILDINEAASNVQKQMSEFHQKEERKKGAFFDLQRQFQTKQMELNDLTNRVNDIKIELARLETKKEDLENEVKEELSDLSLVVESKEKYSGIREDLWPEIQKLKHQLELIGSIDEETVAEYQETKKRYEFLDSQTKDLSNAIKSLEKIIEELDTTIEKQFSDSFRKINSDFEKFFKILFNGGKASLIIQKKSEEEKEDTVPEEDISGKETEESICEKVKRLKKSKLNKMIAGIEIRACPPGKKLRDISMLSGGERALTSIALICAIISNNPAPFVLLDEVDAALDESNSIRFAEIISELSSKTQFIVITHNRYTMEKSGILYGITMGDDGVSQLLSMKLEEAAKLSSK